MSLELHSVGWIGQQAPIVHNVIPFLRWVWSAVIENRELLHNNGVSMLIEGSLFCTQLSIFFLQS